MPTVVRAERNEIDAVLRIVTATKADGLSVRKLRSVRHRDYAPRDSESGSEGGEKRAVHEPPLQNRLRPNSASRLSILLRIASLRRHALTHPMVLAVRCAEAPHP